METDHKMTLDEFLRDWNDPSPTLLVRTSGSTGSPKPMLVEKRRMAESARITCRFLGLKRGDTALLCMPLDYIAGKMMVVRAVVCGLKLTCVEPSGHPLRTQEEPPVFAAMVPMQVYNSLTVEEERRKLMAIKHLIIGGGGIDEALEEQLRDFPNAVWSTYGMTETLSHIALRRLNGAEASHWYTPFDGVNVCLNDDGCLVIDAPAVCPATLTTNDRAVINADRRRFRILGRRDNVVCSGGIKMQIEEMERSLRSYLHSSFMITKRKDPRFGEIVVMLTESSDIEAVRETCRQHLSKYEWPKLFITVERLPLTATGKPARAEAMRIAEAAESLLP